MIRLSDKNMNNINIFLKTINNLGFKLGNKEQKNVDRYLAIPNIEDAKWLLPLNDNSNRRNSILLYQPSTIKGYLLKSVYLMIPVTFAKNILKANLVTLNNINILNNKNLFRDKNIRYTDIYYSFFLGTKGAHCKTTIQISDKSNPIMYLKLTDNPEIAQLFNNEDKILRLLSNTVMRNNIPIVLSNTKNGDYYYFASSTTKTTKSKYKKTLSIEHVNFLVDLYLSTKGKVISNESKYYIDTKNLLINYLNKNKNSQWIMNIFEEVFIKIKNTKLTLGVCHRDFTFWNCYFNDNKIFVFDWEYAIEESLPYIDILHFIIQKSILDNEKCEEIYKRVIDNKFILKYSERINVSSEMINEFMILYLIDILLLYEFRGEELSTSELKVKKKRLDLIKYIWEERE